MKIIIATLKSWNVKNAIDLKNKYLNEHEIMIITCKEELTNEIINAVNPDYIFFPHWSYIIPRVIYEKYCCVVFHMTDLPFGRGGSPLQNLIVRGIYDTKISAIRVSAGIDTGNIFMKKDFYIGQGSAEEIFTKMSNVIFEDMIPAFLKGNISEVPQKGEPTVFKRRTPEDSKIPEKLTINQMYDYIRMLDGEGYPRAFLDYGEFRFLFNSAYYENNKLHASVEIMKRGGDIE